MRFDTAIGCQRSNQWRPYRCCAAHGRALECEGHGLHDRRNNDVSVGKVERIGCMVLYHPKKHVLRSSSLSTVRTARELGRTKCGVIATAQNATVPWLGGSTSSAPPAKGSSRDGLDGDVQSVSEAEAVLRKPAVNAVGLVATRTAQNVRGSSRIPAGVRLPG
jgi:hypothetical protein